jgi:methylmalonyl-CoA/ethylmalonyl-CoA epimerase
MQTRGAVMDLNLGQLAQVAFPVSDVDRAIEFFQGKLGLKLLFRPHENMVFFDCDGVRLYVERAEDIAQASILYFLCDDIGAATKALEGQGVEIISQPHRVSEQPAYDLWMSFFKDPDGHVLALEMHAPKGYALP